MPETHATPQATTHPFFTIGHSTRSIEELASLVREAGADLVVDVRTIPRSRTNPQFNADQIAGRLVPFGLGYRGLAALGGLRGRQAGGEASLNTMWRNKSFRNYADYALTPAFRSGLAELITLGRTHVCAVMCAEAVWWRCHRRIIADYLLASGLQVTHILGRDHLEPATLTPGAEETPQGLVYG